MLYPRVTEGTQRERIYYLYSYSYYLNCMNSGIHAVTCVSDKEYDFYLHSRHYLCRLCINQHTKVSLSI